MGSLVHAAGCLARPLIVLSSSLVWPAENSVDVETLTMASTIVILITLVCAEIQVSWPGDGRSPFMAFLDVLLFLAPMRLMGVLPDYAASFVLRGICFAFVRFSRDFHNLLRRHLTFAFSSRFLEMNLPCCLHYTVSTENNAN